MVVSATPRLKIRSKHNYNNTNNIHLIFTFPRKISTISRRRPAVITCSQKPTTTEMGTNQKRELLEHYGLNPDDYLSQPLSPKKQGRGKKGPPREMKVKQIRETHKLLQVLGGTAAKRKKLISPKGMDVRPMMEVVKGAAFAMLQAAGGCPASLRPGRWLDLYSGTGSVGIGALSRGCSEVHFVEMDPWVVSDILHPNLEWTGFLDVSVIHTVRVESFLDRAEHFVGKNGPFNYVSVIPPYTQVDYGADEPSCNVIFDWRRYFNISGVSFANRYAGLMWKSYQDS